MPAFSADNVSVLKNSAAASTVNCVSSRIFLPSIFTCSASARSLPPPHSGHCAYPRYLLKNTRTCSLYFLRSSAAKNPCMPGHLPSPSSTSSRCSAFKSCHGTSNGTPLCRANFRNSACHGRYFGLVNGSIAPSLSVFVTSGITRFKSKSIVLPNPWHRGHAPKGLLNENSGGSGSSYLMWQFLHSKRWLKRHCICVTTSKSSSSATSISDCRGGTSSNTVSPASRYPVSSASTILVR